VRVVAPIALTDTFSFSSVLSATLCFKRGLPAERRRTDSNGVLGTEVPFYASTQCQFMLQGTMLLFVLAFTA
jgi:hypothetical protein